MTFQNEIEVPNGAPKGGMRDSPMPKGRDVLERREGFRAWQDERRESGMWPFPRSTETGPDASCTVRDDRGGPSTGLNFALQDHRGPSAHPAVAEGQARFRFQVMAGHFKAEIETAAACISAGMNFAALQLKAMARPVPPLTA